MSILSGKSKNYRKNWLGKWVPEPPLLEQIAACNRQQRILNVLWGVLFVAILIWCMAFLAGKC